MKAARKVEIVLQSLPALDADPREIEQAVREILADGRSIEYTVERITEKFTPAA